MKFDKPSENGLSFWKGRLMMKTLSSKDTAPHFDLKDQDGRNVRLSDFKGKKLFLYFYPKANTSG
jgi:peroxiredoxin Q/BCP